MNLLQMKEVNTYYGVSHILFDVSLTIEEGSMTGLLGRNGAGKTTTLRSIMGLTTPRTGEIVYQGDQIAGLTAHKIANKGIAYVPDDRKIFPDLTVYENLIIAEPTVRRRETPRWTLERVYKLFPVLEKMAVKRGINISGGEQKMLSIGRALMRDPDLILLDEPTEGLAPMIVRMFIGVFEEIRQEGVTVLVADQNVQFARKLIDYGYIIDKGTIEYDGQMEEIWKNSAIVSKYLAV
jgi:branched-chain amino acid transport system ATP-binding protein